jgi:hypothetical protein
MVELLDAERAQRLARVGGALYLIIIVIGALGEAVVRGRPEYIPKLMTWLSQR